MVRRIRGGLFITSGHSPREIFPNKVGGLGPSPVLFIRNPCVTPDLGNARWDFRRGVGLVGDLDERMGKVEMLKLMEEEAAAGSSGAVAPSKKAPKKRRASTQPEKEARHEKKKKKEASTSEARPERIPEEGRDPMPPKHQTEDRPRSPPVITIAEASSPKKKGPGRVPPLDYSEDPLAMAWGGEVVRRLTRAHRAVTTIRRSFDETMGQHAELMARLEELEALKVQEQRAVEAREEELEAQLAVEKAAREATKSELDAVLAKKAVVEIELEETKAHAEEEVGRLKSEAIHTWDLSKEEFLQSSKFETLCVKKALCYFKDGFAGCLDQFRANGYSEEEHPTSFLDTKKALMEMPDEYAEEEEEEQRNADVTPPELPPLNDCICILLCVVTFVFNENFSSYFITRVAPLRDSPCCK
ncbi:hypothetical protein F511_37676 [Dorcoceras hygrometricum]|uniref:Uncharacterized protein n=1 Tax=Dorcoceras hygrometricum TaxID=472368 RepID=A0A2Z7APF0_9LAMI|nr:hypothetical protein F511_37676 [Dorcoceras hygrometricum]